MKKRKNINDVVNETMEQFGKVTVVCKLQNIIDDVGLNLRELSLLTGIRYASLNELKNGKKVTLNLQHTLAIMVALRVKSFDQLFELVFEDENEAARFDAEAEDIHVKQFGLPDSERQKIRENAIRLEREKELKN